MADELTDWPKNLPRELVDHQLRGYVAMFSQVEQILAAVLDYPMDDGVHFPADERVVTVGTPVTLAREAAALIAELKEKLT